MVKMAVEYCNIFAFKLDHDIVALVTTPVSEINVEFGYRNGPTIAKGGKISTGIEELFRLRVLSSPSLPGTKAGRASGLGARHSEEILTPYYKVYPLFSVVSLHISLLGVKSTP